MRAFVAPTFRHVVRLFPADRREYGTRTALVRLVAAGIAVLAGRLKYRLRRRGWRLVLR